MNNFDKEYTIDSLNLDKFVDELIEYQHDNLLKGYYESDSGIEDYDWED